jgi:hypothetical protein
MIKPTTKWLILPAFVILAAPGWISLYLREEPKLPEMLKMSEIKKMVIDLMASGEVKVFKMGGGPASPAPVQKLTAQEMATLAQIIRVCVQSKWNIGGGGDSAELTEVSSIRMEPWLLHLRLRTIKTRLFSSKHLRTLSEQCNSASPSHYLRPSMTSGGI